MENKIKYQITLNAESSKKVRKVLKVAGLTLSGYLTVLVDEFARLIDESGYSKILEHGLDKLKLADALMMVGSIMGGIKIEKKHSK